MRLKFNGLLDIINELYHMEIKEIQNEMTLEVFTSNIISNLEKGYQLLLNMKESNEFWINEEMTVVDINDFTFEMNIHQDIAFSVYSILEGFSGPM